MFREPFRSILLRGKWPLFSKLFQPLFVDITFTRLPKPAETFHCRQDINYEHDRYAVSIFVSADDPETVGHLPREISKVGFYFLQHDGHLGRLQFLSVSLKMIVTSENLPCTLLSEAKLPSGVIWAGEVPPS